MKDTYARMNKHWIPTLDDPERMQDSCLTIGNKYQVWFNMNQNEIFIYDDDNRYSVPWLWHNGKFEVGVIE